MMDLIGLKMLQTLRATKNCSHHNIQLNGVEPSSRQGPISLVDLSENNYVSTAMKSGKRITAETDS